MRFRAPKPEAILVDYFSICSFQDRISSISTPSDIAYETCLIETPYINRQRWGSLESLKSFPGAYQQLYLGCLQSQLVSNEPVNDINQNLIWIKVNTIDMIRIEGQMSVICIHTTLTMGKTIWEVVNRSKKQQRSQNSSLRNAAGQQQVVRQMTIHETFLITITQIGPKPIIGNVLNAIFISF